MFPVSKPSNQQSQPLQQLHLQQQPTTGNHNNPEQEVLPSPPTKNATKKGKNLSQPDEVSPAVQNIMAQLLQNNNTSAVTKVMNNVVNSNKNKNNFNEGKPVAMFKECSCFLRVFLYFQLIHFRL